MYKVLKKKMSLLLAVMLFLLAGCAEKPKTFEGQYDLGVKYISEGNYKQAVIALSAAIEIEPNSAIAYLNRGNAYYGQHMMDEAIDDYSAAIDLGIDTSEVYINLTQLYVDQKMYASALEACKKGLDKFSDDAKLSELYTTLTEDLMVTPWEERDSYVSENELPSETRDIIKGLMNACTNEEFDAAENVVANYVENHNPISELNVTYTTTIDKYKVKISITDYESQDNDTAYCAGYHVTYEMRSETDTCYNLTVTYCTGHSVDESAIKYYVLSFMSGHSTSWYWDGEVNWSELSVYRNTYLNGDISETRSETKNVGLTAIKSLMYGSVTTEITESESYIGNWSNPGTSTNTATVTRTLDGESVISGEDSSQGTESQVVRDAMFW